jgi:hypothetical protein
MESPLPQAAKSAAPPPVSSKDLRSIATPPSTSAFSARRERRRTIPELNSSSYARARSDENADRHHPARSRIALPTNQTDDRLIAAESIRVDSIRRETRMQHLRCDRG